MAPPAILLTREEGGGDVRCSMARAPEARRPARDGMRTRGCTAFGDVRCA
jgi:hypothetical protein